MALKTLKGIEKVGELHGLPFDIVVMDELREKFPEKFNESGQMDWEWFEKDIRPNKFIYVRHDKNSLSFTLQNGPVKENGVNGCQVDTIIEVAKTMLEGLDADVPCVENQQAIVHLGFALRQLEKRRLDREKRGVEGTSAE